MKANHNRKTSNCLNPILWLAIFLLPMSSYAQDYWAHKVGVLSNQAYGDDPAQTYDLYAQGQRVGEPNYFNPKSPTGTLIWIHGGGWIGGDKATEVPNFIPYLERGWNVFRLNYRQGPDTAPLAVDDVLCAYQHIINFLRESGQDPNNVVVSGASAGGHLSLVVGLVNAKGTHPCKTNVTPKAVVNWFGITDISLVAEYLDELGAERNYASTWAGSASKLNEVSDLYSPIYLISDQAPPIITIHGTNDTVVPYDQAESFHSSLNTTNELVTLEGGNHSGFSNAQYIHAFEQIFKFLNSN